MTNSKSSANINDVDWVFPSNVSSSKDLVVLAASKSAAMEAEKKMIESTTSTVMTSGVVSESSPHSPVPLFSQYQAAAAAALSTTATLVPEITARLEQANLSDDGRIQLRDSSTQGL